MSVTQLTVVPIGESLLNDTAIGNSVDGIKATSAILNNVTIDNTANGPTGSNPGGTGAYLKLYNTQSGNVIVGTTEPDEVIYGPAGAEISVDYWTATEVGKSFPTALSMSCETMGATGATGPSFPVIVTVAYQ